LALILDTGPLLAALDAADPDHATCAALLTAATEDLIVPVLVLSELDYWCSARLSGTAWDIFLEDLIAGVYTAVAPTTADLQRCRELQTRYADLNLGVVDASVIALAERLDENKVATLDHRHFTVVRPLHTDALRLVP
jgi:uncharacterized protein